LLVVARTVTALTRLLDVVALTSPDWRIQTRFTVDTTSPAMFGAGLREHLDALGVQPIPWDEAVKTRYDLILAASENDGFDQLDGPTLLVPHGVGFEKYYPGTRVVAGLDPSRLLAGGEVVPAAIGLSHPRQQALLSRLCPPAATRSRVIGDPTLDRMRASRHHAGEYRRRLGSRTKCLVVAASTWGPESLLGRWPQLPDRLAGTLPADEYQLAVVLHPGVWAEHGPWQVRAWLSRASDAGVRVLGPHQGWQAALVAASCVLADHGSTALYAAALNKPLLLVAGGSRATVTGSDTAELRRVTAGLDGDGDLLGQIQAVLREPSPELPAVSLPPPGTDALRALLYELLALSPPAPAELPPFPAPEPQSFGLGALIAGATIGPEHVTVVRYPDIRAGVPHDTLDHRHLVADPAAATISQVAAASVLRLAPVDARWAAEADELLRQWPVATLIAGVLDGDTCRIRSHSQDVLLHAPLAAEGLDPLLLASLAYARLGESSSLRTRERLRVGDRIMPVTVTEAP
jgi:hypothetical protein